MNNKSLGVLDPSGKLVSRTTFFTNHADAGAFCHEANEA